MSKKSNRQITSAPFQARFTGNSFFSSIEDIPGFEARAAFTTDSTAVFKETTDISPIKIDDKLEYMPWGGDNQMPYEILMLIEND